MVAIGINDNENYEVMDTVEGFSEPTKSPEVDRAQISGGTQGYTDHEFARYL